MQIREGGAVDVDEIVAVTMGPESAFRALHKAVSLGADRSVHLTDDALAGSDVCATGYALAQGARGGVARPRAAGPAVGRRRVLHDRRGRGRPPEDAVADPGHQDRRRGRQARAASARPSTATTPSRSSCPAVISVGDAINEPRYPSLKAIMGAKKKPLDTKVDRRRRHRGRPGRRARARATEVLAINPPPEKAGRRDHRGRGHQRDGREDRRLARGKEAAGMSGSSPTHFTTRASSTRTRSAPSPRPPSSPSELGGEAARRGRRRRRPDRRARARRSASTAPPRSTAPRRPRASPSRSST